MARKRRPPLPRGRKLCPGCGGLGHVTSRLLTAEQFAAVWRRLEAGDNITTACREVGVSRSAVEHRRVKLGRPPWPKPSLEAALRPDPPLMPDVLAYAAALDAFLERPRDPDRRRAWRLAGEQLLGGRGMVPDPDPPPGP